MTRNSITALMMGAALFLSACAQQDDISEPIRAEPIYNKYGEAEGCREPDGTIRPVGTAAPVPLENPCDEPDDCEGGFYDSTGEYICPDPDVFRDGPDTSSGTSGGGRGSTAGTAGRT